jgi:hypothetical protein
MERILHRHAPVIILLHEPTDIPIYSVNHESDKQKAQNELIFYSASKLDEWLEQRFSSHNSWTLLLPIFFKSNKYLYSTTKHVRTKNKSAIGSSLLTMPNHHAIKREVVYAV